MVDGYYVDLGWYIPNTKWEIDLRYDDYTRGEHHLAVAPNDETTQKTTTIGAQYHFNKKTRVNMEFTDRNFKSATSIINANIEDVKGRFAIQLSHIFEAFLSS